VRAEFVGTFSFSSLENIANRIVGRCIEIYLLDFARSAEPICLMDISSKTSAITVESEHHPLYHLVVEMN
jgi:hypothetical protein